MRYVVENGAWGFLKGYQDRLELLQQNGVTATIAQITLPENAEGISFPVADLEKLCSTLDLEVGSLEQRSTNIENVYLLCKRKGQITLSRSANRSCASCFNRRSGLIIEHLRTLELPEDLSVVLHFNELMPIPVVEGTLHIGINCKINKGDAETLETGNGIVLVGKKVFNIAIPRFEECNGDRGIENDHLAEFNDGCAKMLRIALSKDVELEEFLMKAREEERVRCREAYISACLVRTKNQITKLEKELAMLKGNIANATQTIINCTRQHDEIDAQKVGLETRQSTEKERLLKEFDDIHKISHVRRVTVNSSGILVYTDTIWLTHDGDRYEIGDFKIFFEDGGRLYIVNQRVQELTKQNFYQHPHIFGQDGSDVCLGNLRAGIVQLIGAYEYGVATSMLIDFLHSITPEPKYVGYLKNNWKPVLKHELSVPAVLVSEPATDAVAPPAVNYETNFPSVLRPSLKSLSRLSF
ncbi:MAG: hypothetical protein HZA95_01445 [Candidatus Vogelbacteria bacterium]|nr:hypothetical protein [Candidatus Vogelbacteria bacterium]